MGYTVWEFQPVFLWTKPVNGCKNRTLLIFRFGGTIFIGDQNYSRVFEHVSERDDQFSQSQSAVRKI